jgi:hypothetical protein
MRIRRFIAAIGLLVIAGLPAAAQSVPAPSLFTISGNASSFGSGHATSPAIIASAAIQLTPRVSVGYEHIAISAVSTRYEMGVAAYTLPASALLGSRITSKLLLDVSKVGVTFDAGAGKVLEPTANRIAEMAGVHISYPLMDGLSLQLIGVDVLHGGGHTNLLTVNTSAAISTGINIYFGHR